MMDVGLLAPMIAEGQMIGGVRGLGSGISPPAMGRDAFSLIFTQLMKHQGENGLDPALESLLWLPFAADQKDDKKPGLLEMLAAMLDLPPLQLDFRQYDLRGGEDGEVKLDDVAIREISLLTSDKLGEWMQAIGGLSAGEAQEIIPEGTEAAAAETLLENQQAMLPPDILSGSQQAAARKAVVQSPQEALPMKEPVVEIDGHPVRVLGYQAPEGNEGDSVFRGQEQFRQAVQEARTKLAEKDGKGGNRATEAAAGEDVYRTLAGKLQAEAKPLEKPDIPEQIFSGLSQNLKAGRGEFVIKLVPEGLGEITVKLLSLEGRTTLRLITASAETAKLINNDLAALQNALRPIRVEVQEAVQESPEGREAAGYFAGFDQFNQFNQYGNQRGQDLPSGGAAASGVTAEADEFPLEAPQAAFTDSDLDTYI